jgi:hypothetical protein
MLLRGRFGHSQAIYGSLFGTVLDNTGAVVPNAKVTVTDGSKGTQTVVQSNGEGFWRVDNAQVFVISGVYQLPFGKEVVSWTISSGATVSAALPPGKAVRVLHRPTPSAAWIKTSIKLQWTRPQRRLPPQQRKWRVCVARRRVQSRYPIRPVLHAFNNSRWHWIEPLRSPCLRNLRQRRPQCIHRSA